MFLYHLNLLEKMSFVQLAKEIVKVDDGKIDEQEYQWLAVMANEMQISIDDNLTIEFDISKLAKSFKSETSQRICLVELISLAQSNSEYHKKQKAMLDALSNIFDLSAEEMLELESWVSEMMSLNDKGTKLISRES